MASSLMVTISGVRGVVGESLFPHIVVKYISAFGTLQKGKRLVLGSDSRVSGPWIRNLVHGVLMAQGYEILDLGIVTTPTVQLMVKLLKTDGGVIITSSHNPIEWNGLKFVDRDSLFLSPQGCVEMFKIADTAAFHFPTYQKMGYLRLITDANQQHIRTILALPYIHAHNIRARKFKVCLDTVNGAGGPIMKDLLKELGCEVIGLNLDPSGVFAHKPEPIPEHLGELCESVKKHKAHLGIAVDPDVDRCVLIDENGVPLGEEYTLALAVEYMLGKVGRRGPVVKNLSSSRASDEIAKKYDCPMLTAPVGEINVAVLMNEKNAVIGGEGNGGVMLPDVHIGRDAPVAAVLTLQHLAGFSGTISQLKQTLPQWEIVKLKANLSGLEPDQALAAIKAHWAPKLAELHMTLDERDGLKFDAPDYWVHLRKSNTEPIIRVIGEARTRAEAQKVCESFMQQIVDASKK